VRMYTVGVKEMFYIVLCGDLVAGLYTSPVDAHLRAKPIGGRVVQCRANEDNVMADVAPWPCHEAKNARD